MKRKIILSNDDSIHCGELKNFDSGLIIAEDSFTGRIKGYVSRDTEGSFIYTDKLGSGCYDSLESLISDVISENNNLEEINFYFID